MNVFQFNSYNGMNDFVEWKKAAPVTTQPTGEGPPQRLPYGEEAVWRFKLDKTDSVLQLLANCADRGDIPMAQMRLWSITMRKNKVLKPTTCCSTSCASGFLSFHFLSLPLLPLDDKN